MAINTIFSSAQGFEFGLIAAEMKRQEDSVRAGRSNYLTALLQWGQAIKAVEFSNKAYEAAGLPLFSWTEKSVVYLTPILLAVLKNTDVLPENFRPVLTFCQDHLSDLYQIANVVSCIALLSLGQTAFAASSLCILGIGAMDRYGLLPVACRQFLHRYTQPLFIVTALITGGTFDRIIAVLSALAWGAEVYFARNQVQYETFTFKQNLTPKIMQDFLAKRLTVRIHQNFIHYNPTPPIPNVDIQFFIEKFDEIDWEPKNIFALREKLNRDARFIARHGTTNGKADNEIIAIARETLQTFIDTVKERRVLAGEPADYEKLHNYLKLIVQAIERERNPILRTDMLLRLAVEGGEYCGPGKFEVAESVYAQTVGENPDLPFHDKVSYCLQDERNDWMQKWYNRIFTPAVQASTIGQIIEPLDLHNYNIFLNCYGDELGLRKAGADNDATAFVDALSKWVLSHTAGSIIQTEFWNEHNLYNHTQILKSNLGTSKLPLFDAHIFWQNWIERQQIEEEAKEVLRDELALHQSLYGRALERGGEFTYEFIVLMLLDMGIVEIDS